jgi:ribose transport system permease protein
MVFETSTQGTPPKEHGIPDATPTAKSLNRFRETLSYSRRYATFGILAVLIIVFTLTAPDFMTVSNWQDILVTQAVPICIGLAALAPLVVGEFDLSLGYALGFVTMLGAWVAEHGAGTLEVILIMLIAGIVIGLVNGILTVVFGISSFIATLGTGILLSGFVLGISSGEVLFAGISPFILEIGKNEFLGLSLSVWIALALAIIMLYVLEHTPMGRHLYAIGGSERVAFLAGVRTRFLKVAAFGLAGLLVAIGSILELSSGAGANPNTGPNFLLPAYAAAFLGVTVYKLGRYNVVGTIVAVILLAVGFDGLSLLGVPYWGEPVFDGAVLVLAVLFARAEARHVAVG